MINFDVTMFICSPLSYPCIIHIGRVESGLNNQSQIRKPNVYLFSYKNDRKGDLSVFIYVCNCRIWQPRNYLHIQREALESVMCDVIKMRVKRWDATRSKIKCKLQIKFGIPPLTLAALQLFQYLAAGFVSHFSLNPSILNVFLWRHTWHFPALQPTSKLQVTLDTILQYYVQNNLFDAAAEGRNLKNKTNKILMIQHCFWVIKSCIDFFLHLLKINIRGCE